MNASAITSNEETATNVYSAHLYTSCRTDGYVNNNIMRAQYDMIYLNRLPMWR